MERSYIITAFVLVGLVGIGVYDGISTGFVDDSSELLFAVPYVVEEVAVVNGSVMYIADLGEEEGLFRGRKQLLSADNLEQLTVVDGQPAFVIENNGTISVVSNGQRTSVAYSFVEQLKDVAGSAAYIAESGDGDKVVVWRGEIYGEQYNTVRSLTEADGLLAYLAVEGNRNVIVYNGETIETTYNATGGLVYTERGFAYNTGQFVVMNGTRKSECTSEGHYYDYHFEEIRGMSAGEPVYTVNTVFPDALAITRLCHNGRLMGNHVRFPVYMQGGWAYVDAADRHSGEDALDAEWAVFYNGTQITRSYPHIDSLHSENDSLIFVTWINNRDYTQPRYTSTFRRVKLD